MQLLDTRLATNLLAFERHVLWATLVPNKRRVTPTEDTNIDDVANLLDIDLPVIECFDNTVVIVQILLRNSVMLEETPIQLKDVRWRIVVGDESKE